MPRARCSGCSSPSGSGVRIFGSGWGSCADSARLPSNGSRPGAGRCARPLPAGCNGGAHGARTNRCGSPPPWWRARPARHCSASRAAEPWSGSPRCSCCPGWVGWPGHSWPSGSTCRPPVAGVDSVAAVAVCSHWRRSGPSPVRLPGSAPAWAPWPWSRRPGRSLSARPSWWCPTGIPCSPSRRQHRRLRCCTSPSGRRISNSAAAPSPSTSRRPMCWCSPPGCCGGGRARSGSICGKRCAGPLSCCPSSARQATCPACWWPRASCTPRPS